METLLHLPTLWPFRAEENTRHNLPKGGEQQAWEDWLLHSASCVMTIIIPIDQNIISLVRRFLLAESLLLNVFSMFFPLIHSFGLVGSWTIYIEEIISPQRASKIFMLWRILLSLLCSSDLLVLEYRDGQLKVAILTQSDIQRKAGQYDHVFFCVLRAVAALLEIK